MSTYRCVATYYILSHPSIISFELRYQDFQHPSIPLSPIFRIYCNCTTNSHCSSFSSFCSTLADWHRYFTCSSAPCVTKARVSVPVSTYGNATHSLLACLLSRLAMCELFVYLTVCVPKWLVPWSCDLCNALLTDAKWTYESFVYCYCLSAKLLKNLYASSRTDYILLVWPVLALLFSAVSPRPGVRRVRLSTPSIVFKHAKWLIYHANSCLNIVLQWKVLLSIDSVYMLQATRNHLLSNAIGLNLEVKT